MEMINAIGRRKASVARVYLTQGSGKMVVNGKSMEEYFPVIHTQFNLVDPMRTVGVEGVYDIKVNVNGGGFKGQAEAVRLAISRALVKIDEENRKPLKDKKYLMRDSRVVERKKYGKPNIKIAKKGFSSTNMGIPERLKPKNSAMRKANLSNVENSMDTGSEDSEFVEERRKPTIEVNETPRYEIKKDKEHINDLKSEFVKKMENKN